MNANIIGKLAIGAATIVAKVANIGTTQIAVQSLQQTNRKDIDGFMKGDTTPGKLKLVTKEDLKQGLPKGKTDVKDGAKKLGFGALRIMKVGTQTQAIYSLNETNRNQMKELDGQMRRGVKYNVTPKIKNIGKIKISK